MTTSNTDTATGATAAQPLVVTADHADGKIREIRLNNHAKRNSLNIPMCDAIEEAMLAAVEDGARVVLLHGDGTVFSAGADLSGDVYAGGFYPRLLRMLGTIQTLRSHPRSWPDPGDRYCARAVVLRTVSSRVHVV